MRTTYIIALIIMAGCGAKNDQETVSKIITDDRVVLTDDQSRMLNIETDTLRKEPLQSVIRFSAVMENSPDGRAIVSPKLGGYIKAILVSEGSQVKKGQAIAELENLELIRMQEEYLSISAEFDFLSKEITRQRQLNQNKSISDKSLQETEMRLMQANAKRNALIAAFDLLGMESNRITSSNITGMFQLYSPMNGIITSVKGDVGAYLNAADIVVEISDKKDLLLVGKLYERDRDKIFIGGHVKFYLNANPNELYDAEVIRISGKINVDKSLSVYCRMSCSPDAFVAGMIVNAELMLQTQIAIPVPENAVVSFENRNFIFTASPSNEYIMTEIEILDKAGGEVQIADTTLHNSIFVKTGAHSLLMALKNTAEE